METLRTTEPRMTEPRKTQPRMDSTLNGLNLEFEFETLQSNINICLAFVPSSEQYFSGLTAALLIF